jgi:hypothetical protein
MDRWDVLAVSGLDNHAPTYRDSYRTLPVVMKPKPRESVAGWICGRLDRREDLLGKRRQHASSCGKIEAVY